MKHLSIVLVEGDYPGFYIVDIMPGSLTQCSTYLGALRFISEAIQTLEKEYPRETPMQPMPPLASED